MEKGGIMGVRKVRVLNRVAYRLANQMPPSAEVSESWHFVASLGNNARLAWPAAITSTQAALRAWTIQIFRCLDVYAV